MATSNAVWHCLASLWFPISNDPQETRSRLALQHCARKCAFCAILPMQRASPSPAEFTVSHPYVFSFYFVPSDRRQDLACLARLP
jgi:hypothetical protein